MIRKYSLRGEQDLETTKKSHVFFIRQSIQARLIIWFLVVGLLPLGSAMAIVYQISSNKMIEKEQGSMQVLATSTAQGMTQWLEQRLGEIQLAAKTDAMASLDPKRQLSLVKKVKEQSSSYETVVFTSPDGIVRAHTTAKNIGVMKLADRDYFQKGMQGESIISSILKSKTTGNRIIVVATPVKSVTGKIIGVMSATINFEDLVHTFLLNSSINKNGIYPILVDDQNHIQVYPQQETVGKSVSESGLSQEMTSLLGGAPQGTTKTLVLTDKGEQFVMSYAPIDLAHYRLYLRIPMKDVLTAANQIKLATWLVMGISTLCIILIAWVVSRNLSRPIRAVTSIAKSVADGDLTGEEKQITTRDEIGQLSQNFYHMKQSLKALIQQVYTSSEYVAASASELTISAEQTSKLTEQITNAMEQVSSGADLQNTGVAESRRSLQELSSGVYQMAEFSTTISKTSAHTIQKAQEGGISVQKAVDQMQSIHGSVTESDQIIKLLDERSKEIGKILDVVTGIARQTNLLALNAAIEAARAGEHGRGFAVVADEVRKLAEESQRSSSLIGNLIAEMQQDVVYTIDAMGQVKNKVNEGILVANETKRSFQEIIDTTGEVASQIQRIAVTAEQMSAGANQLTTSFSEMALVSQTASSSTQEVAASAQEQLASMEEITSSAESLQQLAFQLKEMIRQFKI